MIITQSALEKIGTLLSLREVFQISVTGSNPSGFHVDFHVIDFFVEHVDSSNAIWIDFEHNIVSDYESFAFLFDKQLDYNSSTNEFILTPQE